PGEGGKGRVQLLPLRLKRAGLLWILSPMIFLNACDLGSEASRPPDPKVYRIPLNEVSEDGCLNIEKLMIHFSRKPEDTRLLKLTQSFSLKSPSPIRPSFERLQ